MFAFVLEGDLTGEKYDYPLTLQKHSEDGRSYVDTQIEHEDELFEYIEQQIENNKGKNLKQVLVDSGIKHTINLVDDRTLQLLHLYKFYSNSSTPQAPFWDTQVWYDVVTMCELAKPKGFNFG